MVDVFISYSRKDEAAVARLAGAIMAEGYDVWWDAELPPHRSYGEVITDKIAEARAAVVVWSADAVQSEWVRAEADMARGQRKLIQTALDAVPPPLPFNQIQYAEIGDWQGETDHPGWRKVKVSLAELCGGGAPPRPAPPAPLAVPPAQGGSGPVSRWPLYAGGAVAAIGLAVAGGVVLGGRHAASAPETPPPSAAPAPPSRAEAPAAAPSPAPPPAPSPPAAIPGDADDVPSPDPADMTFPDSSTRLLQASEIAPLGPSTLKIARNEIFARKGLRFRTPFLQQWFARFSWYRPRVDTVTLNPVERANVELIRQAEARYGG
jgi:hypothetical protein